MSHSISKHDVGAVARSFQIPGDFLLAAPYGSGHINDTYRVSFSQAGTGVDYIFQRINHNVFKNPPAVMENIERVTSHLLKRIPRSGCGGFGSTPTSTVGETAVTLKDAILQGGNSCQDATRRTMSLVRARDGATFHRDADGNYWRAYLFIQNAKTYDVIESEAQAFQAAKAFGGFQSGLVDLPGGRLTETIPYFHDTPRRFDALEKALAADVAGRARLVSREIDFAMSRKADASLLLRLNAEGAIPERVTHNDTKLNNVMIDDQTGEGICVIDLDTVMPGLAHYDFGDMVRTGTSPAAEDETDLGKVRMQFNMFEALLRGYLSSAGSFLNPVELEHLPFAGKLITLEIGVRFLTDFLSGDVYFKTRREGHNLDRCRTQFKLAESIESQTDSMRKLLKSI